MKRTSVTRFSWTRMRSLVVSITLGIAATALVFGLQMRAESPNHDHFQSWQTATGQYISPLAVPDSMQQFLNPGLPAYPNFVAGEAVRSQLSPDGKTLAILCAGQNSLDKPDGSTDTAASTQFIFLYDVSGNHKKSPVLTQVIQQTNSHVGLVFSPDGNMLYAARRPRRQGLRLWQRHHKLVPGRNHCPGSYHGHRCRRWFQREWSGSFRRRQDSLLPTTTTIRSASSTR
jgi:hypothetical protein